MYFSCPLGAILKKGLESTSFISGQQFLIHGNEISKILHAKQNVFLSIRPHFLEQLIKTILIWI